MAKRFRVGNKVFIKKEHWTAGYYRPTKDIKGKIKGRFGGRYEVAIMRSDINRVGGQPVFMVAREHLIRRR